MRTTKPKYYTKNKRSVLMLLFVFVLCIQNATAQISVSLGNQVGFTNESLYDISILPTNLTIQIDLLKNTSSEIFFNRMRYNKIVVGCGTGFTLAGNKSNVIGLNAFSYYNHSSKLKVGVVYGANYRFNANEEVNGNTEDPIHRLFQNNVSGFGLQAGLRFSMKIWKRTKFWSTMYYVRYLKGRTLNHLIFDFNIGYEF